MVPTFATFLRSGCDDACRLIFRYRVYDVICATPHFTIVTPGEFVGLDSPSSHVHS